MSIGGCVDVVSVRMTSSQEAQGLVDGEVCLTSSSSVGDESVVLQRPAPSLTKSGFGVLGASSVVW